MTFWNIVWLFIDSFILVAYLYALILVIIDLFRDTGLNGWWKALWVIFLVFVPILTVLVYLIARGRGMAERSASRDVAVAEDDGYRPRPSASPTSDIARAKTLLDQGAISQGEFDAIKSKALTGNFFG